jgi:hypothetical protein
VPLDDPSIAARAATAREPRRSAVLTRLIGGQGGAAQEGGVAGSFDAAGQAAQTKVSWKKDCSFVSAPTGHYNIRRNADEMDFRHLTTNTLRFLNVWIYSRFQRPCIE